MNQNSDQIIDYNIEANSCETTGNQCEIPEIIANFLFNSNTLYTATISESLNVHITPIIYMYSMNDCIISFLIRKNSKKAQNLRKTPFFSLSTDYYDKINPSLNIGITIQAISNFNYDNEEMLRFLLHLRTRYSKFSKKTLRQLPKLVNEYLEYTEGKINENYILVKAGMIRAVYWEGQVFRKDYSLTCPARKYLLKQRFI